MNTNLKPCPTCPHRKIHEGGVLEEGQVPVTYEKVDGELRLMDNSPHLCHEDINIYCRGHIRDLQQIRDGAEVTDTTVIFKKEEIIEVPFSTYYR